jgi:hypothetical protein
VHDVIFVAGGIGVTNPLSYLLQVRGRQQTHRVTSGRTSPTWAGDHRSLSWHCVTLLVWVQMTSKNVFHLVVAGGEWSQESAYGVPCAASWATAAPHLGGAQSRVSVRLRPAAAHPPQCTHGGPPPAPLRDRVRLVPFPRASRTGLSGSLTISLSFDNPMSLFVMSHRSAPSSGETTPLLVSSPDTAPEHSAFLAELKTRPGRPDLYKLLNEVRSHVQAAGEESSEIGLFLV